MFRKYKRLKAVHTKRNVRDKKKREKRLENRSKGKQSIINLFEDWRKEWNSKWGFVSNDTCISLVRIYQFRQAGA
jgi:hypothetical protein